MNRFKQWILMGASALVLSACASTGPQDQAPVEDRGTEAGEAGAETRGAGAEGVGEGEAVGAEARGAEGYEEFRGDELSDPASPLSNRVIYFGFDSSEISAADMEVLTAHGEYLAAHPEQTVVLEGHTDERGSREYNLALGEQRGKAVERVLLLNGAAAEQVETVSYGEEKPAELGQNEEAWGKNRRVELLYTQR